MSYSVPPNIYILHFLHFTLLLNSLLSYSQNHEIISTYYEKVGSTQVHFFWIWVHTFVGYLQTHLGFERENTEILHAFKVHCKDTAGASSIRLLTSQFLYLKPNYFICTTNFHLDTLNDQIKLKTLEKKMWIWIHQSVSWEEGSGELRCPESTWETQKT